MWLHSLNVAQLLRNAVCLHTNQSRSYLNHLVVLYQKFLGQAEENDQSLSQFRRSMEEDSKADALETNLLGYGTQNISRGCSTHDYCLSKAVKK